MNKLIITIIAMVFCCNAVYAQPKVNITLINPRVDAQGYFAMDVSATVLPAQTWKVGSSNIRITWASTPSNGISVKADNPVTNAHSSLNSGNYSAMTTTSISGGAAISLNITRLGNCHPFTPGTYTLGTVRFNRLINNSNVTLTINTNSVMQDSITALQNPAGWTHTNPGGVIVGVNTASSEVPTEYNIYQNYPNPFNPSTLIKFDIPSSGMVILKVYDISGREMAVLVNNTLEPGRYEYTLNASSFSSGVYFYRIISNDYIKTMRMVLLK